MDELIQRIETILLDAKCSRWGSNIYLSLFYTFEIWHEFFYVSHFRDVRQMLLKLVELRSSDWGRVREAVAASNATPDTDPNYFMVRVGRAAHALLPVCQPWPLLPLPEWTHLLHWGWCSFHSSWSRWDTNGKKNESGTWPSWILSHFSTANVTHVWTLSVCMEKIFHEDV